MLKIILCHSRLIISNIRDEIYPMDALLYNDSVQTTRDTFSPTIFAEYASSSYTSLNQE